MYVEVKSLPTVVQNALTSVSYGRKDIEVCPSASVTLSSSSGDGYRAFVTLVNLTTNNYETAWGSWGGSNMFNPENPVDNDHREYVLPDDGLAITGHKGGTEPVWARLRVPASMMNRMLPATPTLTTEQLDALYCYKSIKGGQYRKDALKRLRTSQGTLDGLVELGLLTRNKAGSSAITTAGKNAVAGHQPSMYV